LFCVAVWGLLTLEGVCLYLPHDGFGEVGFFDGDLLSVGSYVTFCVLVFYVSHGLYLRVLCVLLAWWIWSLGFGIRGSGGCFLGLLGV